jgi:hypothetical protein
MIVQNNLASNLREVSPHRRFCGTAGIASESRGRALRRGPPLIFASVLDRIHRTTAMYDIPFLHSVFNRWLLTAGFKPWLLV